MKKYSILFTCLLAGIYISSCRKPAVTGQVYSGKVIKSMCGNIAVQVTDANFGENNWTDDGKKYDNVFAVSNPCTWNPYGITSENIRFRIVGPSPQNCAVCLIYSPVPNTSYNIVVEK